MNHNTTLFIDVSRDSPEGIIGFCLLDCSFPMTVLHTSSQKGSAFELVAIMCQQMKLWEPESVVLDAPEDFWHLLRCYGITRERKILKVLY